MLASEETKEVLRKHHVLTGYNRFIYFGLLAILINVVYSLWGPYKDYEAVYILSPSAVILLSTLWIYQSGRPLLAKIISAITFNTAFLLVSLHIGDQGGTYLYYFPFILAYVYLFRASGKPGYTWGFTLLSLICMFICVLAAPDAPRNYSAPPEKMKEIFHMTFFISILLTIYFFILIYDYQEGLYRRVEELEKNNRIREMRLMMESQEKNNQQLMIELRDNINQTLTASRLFLEKSIEEPENPHFISRSRELTNEAIHTLTMICVKLYPAIVTDVGLSEGIKQFIGEIKKISTVTIRFTETGTGLEEISGNDKIAVFRIIQDYLALLLKSSGVSLVSIHLNYQHPAISIGFSHDDPSFPGVQPERQPDFAGIYNSIRYYNGRISHYNDGKTDTTVVELPLGRSS
jgi:glucose-6-phosphate-specific signal transduction histidine kinase